MHAFDGCRKLRASGRWAGPVIQVWIPFDSLPTRAAAALRTAVAAGTCDDEYYTCWLCACQLQRTGALPLPDNLLHDGGY